MVVSLYYIIKEDGVGQGEAQSKIDVFGVNITRPKKQTKKKPQKTPTTSCRRIKKPSSMEQKVASSASRFSAELFSLLSEKEPREGGNVICSPFSVSSVLAMAMVGAGGNTAAEMRSACGFGDDDEETFRGFQGG